MSVAIDSIVDPTSVLPERKGLRPSVPVLERARILLVDDDPDLSFALGCRLQRAGFDVRTAQDGIAGLTRVEADRPDLVLLDLWLPRMTGFRVLRELHASCGATLPVVVISGDPSMRAHVPQLRRDGARDVFIKPFDTDALIETMESLLSGG